MGCRDTLQGGLYDPMPAFAAYRQRIEQLIITLIRQGRCEDDEMMVIRVRDLLRGGA